MKIRNIILAAVIALASLSFSIGVLAQNNRYGMRLKEKDGELFVSNSRAYRKLGIDVAKLPDVLVPFKPKITAFDRKSVRSVVPDTLVYKTNSAGDDLRLLVYKTSETNAPVVFYIHGGGWTGGNFKSNPAICKTLAGKYGIAVISIQYTFATVPGTKMEDTIGDCYDAVEYVLSRSSEFGIDPDRLGFFGSSAGGHLASCCAMRFPQTKVLAGWYGAYDLQLTMSHYAPESNTKRRELLSDFFNGWDSEYIKSVSPSEMALKTKKTKFKAVLFEGTADTTIGPGNAETFRKALAKAGNKNVELVIFENVTHSITRSYAADEMYLKTIELFNTAL
jgi:acetyl esterase/lipase